MELSVNAILASIDDFLKETGAQAYRAAAGLEPRQSATSRASLLGDVTHAETVAFVRELSQSARLDETKRGRVIRLLAEVLRLAAEARLAPHDDALVDALTRAEIDAAGKRTPAREVLRTGWALQTPEARAAASTAVATAAWDARSLSARRFEALVEAAPALGATSPRALVEAIHGRTFDRQRTQADEALRHSADAARDLTAFALKRIELQKPSSARRFDLERALAAPWCFELLRQEDVQHAVTRTMGDLGFHASALGRVFVDTEPRAVSINTLIRVEVPDQLRLVLTPAPGFDGYSAWLGAWGEAQFLAATPRTLPFIDRVIGDAAPVLAIRRLFESLLLDEAWLKRSVRVTSPQARELARLFAWRQVTELRRDAASLDVVSDLLDRGPVTAVADTYASTNERVSFVQPDRGRAFLETEPLAPALTTLDAWALEAHLAHVLRERFNEDWWRNPAAGRFLVGLAGKGSTENATAWAETLGNGPLSVVDASRRRVVIMGA